VVDLGVVIHKMLLKLVFLPCTGFL